MAADACAVGGTVKNFWVRWYGKAGVGFETATPWWVSGYAGDHSYIVFVAGVRAEDDEAAKRVIVDAYDDPSGILEWSFVDERAEDWSPFTDRFPRKDWMVWPLALEMWVGKQITERGVEQ